MFISGDKFILVIIKSFSNYFLKYPFVLMQIRRCPNWLTVWGSWWCDGITESSNMSAKWQHVSQNTPISILLMNNCVYWFEPKHDKLNNVVMLLPYLWILSIAMAMPSRVRSLWNIQRLVFYLNFIFNVCKHVNYGDTLIKGTLVW